MPVADNESWIIEAGDAVITKREAGVELSPLDRLIYCLWVADYGMRNAGDLDTAGDLYQDFQQEAVDLAGGLGLEFTRGSFSMPREALQQQYFLRLNRICDEIKGV